MLSYDPPCHCSLTNTSNPALHSFGLKIDLLSSARNTLPLIVGLGLGLSIQIGPIDITNTSAQRHPRDLHISAARRLR
jgi:hypothetical protein